jgi:hypothetical protein
MPRRRLHNSGKIEITSGAKAQTRSDLKPQVHWRAAFFNGYWSNRSSASVQNDGTISAKASASAAVATMPWCADAKGVMQTKAVEQPPLPTVARSRNALPAPTAHSSAR